MDCYELTAGGKRYFFETKAEAEKMALKFPDHKLVPWDKEKGNSAVYNRLTHEIKDVPTHKSPTGFICGLIDGANYDLLPNNLCFSV